MSSISETHPQPDEQLELIADGTRRRFLIALLADAPGDTPIEITDRVGDTETTEMIEMQHVHLPKLEDSGFIHWDRENHLVLQGPQFDEIKPLLTLLHDHANDLPDEWL